MSTPGSVSSLNDVLAKQAIAEVIYRYCRGLDRMDKEMAKSVWHTDGTADYGEWYQGSGVGFVDWVWGSHANFERHSHQVTNILIDVVDDDHATSEAYYTAALRQRAADSRVIDIVSRGRYVDRWSRRDGRWAIDHRIAVGDIQSVRECPAELADDTASGGRRDRHDPSYTIVGF